MLPVVFQIRVSPQFPGLNMENKSASQRHQCTVYKKRRCDMNETTHHMRPYEKEINNYMSQYSFNNEQSPYPIVSFKRPKKTDETILKRYKQKNEQKKITLHFKKRQIIKQMIIETAKAIKIMSVSTLIFN